MTAVTTSLSNSPAQQDLPQFPKISVRLCQSQLLLAKPGLVRMVESIHRIREGDFPSPFLPVDYFIGRDTSSLHRDPALAERIMQLWRQVYPATHGQIRQRLHLDFLDLAICQLAVRALRKQVSHGHFESPMKNYLTLARRFLRVLEKLRRRARTAAIRANGRHPYIWVSHRWRRYVRWIRLVALGCLCAEPPLLQGKKRRQTARINKVVAIAERELKIDGYPVPNLVTLRKWARLMLRYSRRYRETVPCDARFLTETREGAVLISSFMAKRVRNLVGKETDG